MVAVSYVGVTNGNSGSATSASFATSLPAGWAAGDVAVLVGHVSGSTLTMSTPSGWTLLPGVTWPVTEDAASRMYAWYRVLQAGDIAPTVTNSGSVTGGWECIVFRGATGITQAATSTASASSVTLPTLTGVASGSTLVMDAHCRVPSGTAAPTALTPAVAYTEVADHSTSRATTNANVRADAGYRLIASAGSYGGETVTSDVAGSMIGLLAEVTPAVTTTQVSGTVATGWSVAASVTSAVATSWAVASTAAGTTATTWAVAASVASTVTTGWSTASVVGAEIPATWATAAEVTGSRQTRWSVTAAAAGAVTTSWDTAAAVSGSVATTWAVDGASLPPPTRGTVRLPAGSSVRMPTRPEVTLL